MPQPLTLLNADVWSGTTFERRDLCMTDVILDQPARRAMTVDLRGCAIFPGMINAHDHLELNHYPRTKFRERYDNAHQWGEDVNARLDQEPFKTLRAYPLEDRLFIGGLKNLLCGVTTVMHHNPPHKPLFRRDFPVRVMRDYLWAHSLHFNTARTITAALDQAVRRKLPLFIHLAEGTDEIAQREFQRLRHLNGSSQAILIHGVGISDADLEAAKPDGGHFRGLVWCPSTNVYLLGAAHSILRYEDAHFNALALGSDSRLTADGDFLDELRFARRTFPDIPPHYLLRLVTWDAAFIVGEEGNIDHLATGESADCIVFRAADDPVETLLHAHRADLALIVRGGVPQIGDPDLMAQFPDVDTVRAELDGVPKAINARLARQIARCTLQEPGLVLLENPATRRFPF